MKKKYNLRAIAAKAIVQVLDQGQSLSTVLPELQNQITEKDRPLLQELCFGVLRVLPQLEWIIQQLMSKVMTGKQRILHYLLMVGLYQLVYMRIPAHAALSETVEATVSLKKGQLKGVINGVLRQFQRQQEELIAQSQQSESKHLHPGWLLKRLQNAYPDQWQQITDANNQKPPMWLRVNRQHHTRNKYLALLNQIGITAFPHTDYPDALRLASPVPVSSLPGFDQGWVTVQDASAQGAALLLDPQDNDSILDLCAAPGGKTTHILEIAPQAKVLAVDIDEKRTLRITENLKRLNQHAHVKVGDGSIPQDWCDEQCFDRILLDAPCSATGVIRRHPDIKWLRRNSDIAELAQLQKKILNAIWPYLAPKGILVYTTCSILPEENQLQVEQFLQEHKDASLTGETIQNLPDPEGGDGFFYAKIVKQSL